MTDHIAISAILQIRPAVRADLPLLEWGGAYRKYRNLFKSTFDDHLRGDRLMLVADLNAYPVGQVFVQYVAGNPNYADGRRRGYLYSLRVMQPLRGLGIGTQLVKRAEDTLLDRGFSWATIAVAKDNARARTLYERLGYQIFTEDPGRWSFVDPDGNVHRVNEPCYGLEKQIRSLSAVRHKQ